MSSNSARRRRNAAQRTATHTTPATSRKGISLVKNRPTPPAAPAAVLDRPRRGLSLVKRPPLPGRTPHSAATGELAIGHAALAATTLGIAARVLRWHAQPDGTAIQRLDHRTTLVHSGQAGDAFTALLLCRQGAEHPVTVTSPTDIDAGHRTAETCQDAHADITHLTQPPTRIVQAFTGIHAATHAIKTNPDVHTLQDAKGDAASG